LLNNLVEESRIRRHGRETASDQIQTTSHSCQSKALESLLPAKPRADALAWRVRLFAILHWPERV